MTIFQYVGSTAPSFQAPIRQNLGGVVTPVDLTGASVNLRLRSQFGGTTLIDAPAVITDTALGLVRYDWTLANTTSDILSSPGPYKAWFHITLLGGAILDSPEFDVEFLDHSPRRSVGPCTDWCSASDVTDCFSDVAAGTCLASAVRQASEALYVMSGRQFPGWCQSVIRPCQDTGCWGGGGMQILSRGHIVWGGYGWSSETQPCSCGYLQVVKLPGVAQGIVEVRIDGVALDPSAYRLDPDNSLIRIDGAGWPICQNMAGNAATDAGTFQVTYAHGYEPPELGKRAAAQLAREFYLACSGLPCLLPSGVTKIVRQGIEITRSASLWALGATGLAMVDSFLATYGDCEPTIVLSPDTIATSRRTS